MTVPNGSSSFTFITEKKWRELLLDNPRCKMHTMYVYTYKCGPFLSYKREMFNDVHSCIDKNGPRISQPHTKFQSPENRISGNISG